MTVEIAADPVEAWAREVAARNGFTQPNHVVDVFGYCPDCTEGASLSSPTNCRESDRRVRSRG